MTGKSKAPERSGAILKERQGKFMDVNLKIAIECTKTQLKMRNQFINEFIETRTNTKDLDGKMVEVLRDILTIAYNKGVSDALKISAIINMEGGEDDEV